METLDLSLDLIDPPLVVERRTLDTEGFRELVADIRDHGLIQAITVRPVANRFRVVAGYRRCEAARAAGLIVIRATIRDMTDAEELAARGRENAHRENPNAAEEGALFAAMQEGLGLTTARIADDVGKSYDYVAGRLELVRGPENIREAVMEGAVSFSVARELLRCAHPADRDNLLYHARRGGCTVALMRSWVHEAAVQRAAQPPTADPLAPVVSQGAPPVPMGVCEWHEKPVPLDSLLSFRVCTTCYQALLAFREDLKRQDAVAEREGAHVEGT